MFDVIVIGGGVVGGLVMREATKYQLKVCLLEKEGDVCMGASKANSGIVHAGYDAKPNTLKAKFNVLGNKMMGELCRELGVKYVNNGSLVIAFDEEEKRTLSALKERGQVNGAEGLEIIDKERLHGLEGNLSPDAIAALYAPTAGTVCPYGLTIAAIGNAMDNGGTLYTDYEVVAIKKDTDGYHVQAKDGRETKAKVVVNCAGYHGGKIARMIGDDYPISGRKGEYILVDRACSGYLSHTVFCTPTEKGKGILVTRTVDGNIMFGPTAEEVDEMDASTSVDGLAFVQDRAKRICKNPPLRHAITSFAGVRAYASTRDFIVKESDASQGFFHCIGIESPGLTAAPALAQYVVEELISRRLPLKKRKDFDGRRAPDYFFKDLSREEQNALIKKDAAYGRVVCRCEGITEGEIIRAIRENPPAKDIDGVKRRTRTGMGRCQGGFCQPVVAQLIAKERGVPIEEVTKKGKGSYLWTGVAK